MIVNIEAVNGLIKREFRNNKSFFADVIGVNRSYLSEILNGSGKEDSNKVCNAIINYCTNKKIDCKEYIFFD